MGNYSGKGRREPQEVQIFPTCTFIDIETVRGEKHFRDLPERMQSLYKKRHGRELLEISTASQLEMPLVIETHYEDNAGLSAEFGKVVCVSLGRFINDPNGGKFYMKTIIEESERALLTQLKRSLERAKTLCAHNGFEFDFPFLERRYRIHGGISVPPLLNTYGLKSWDYPFEDTQAIWSGSAWKHRCSLDLMAELMGVASSKDVMSGADVGPLWYGDKPFEEKAVVLGTYCSGDVLTLANVYNRLRGFTEIKPEQVIYVKE